MRLGDEFQTSFCFLEKLYMRQKQVVCSLVSIYFDRPQLGVLIVRQVEDDQNILKLSKHWQTKQTKHILELNKLCKTLDY